MEFKIIERGEFADCYLTGTPSAPENDGASVFTWAATQLARYGVQPISEKIYGRRSARDGILQQRRIAYQTAGLAVDLPFTFVEGAPFHSGDFTGLQIWGVMPHDPRRQLVETFSFAPGQNGRVFAFDGSRHYYFPALRGLAEDGSLPAERRAQAQRLFAGAVNALSSQGLNYRQVVRTWIYLARLLDWYGEFNAVRSECYHREGIGPEPPAVLYPASTGIQGRADNEECLMDMLALVPAESVAQRVIEKSERQNQSARYKSSFSRGMAVTLGGRKTIYISGTASINSAGDSVHVGDAEMQAVETLLCLAAILKDEGGDLSHIALATCFCKTPEAYAAFRNVTALLGVPAFPLVPVHADVCRDDLLIEIEAMAVI